MRSLRGIRVLRGLPRFPGVKGGGQPPAVGTDTTPDVFSLGGPINDAIFGAYFDSDEIEISGVDWICDVNVTNCLYSKNGGAWISTPGTGFNGDKFRVRVLSALGFNSTEIGTLDIGGNITPATSATFSVTTATDPVTPSNMFDFTFPDNMKHLPLVGM